MGNINTSNTPRFQPGQFVRVYDGKMDFDDFGHITDIIRTDMAFERMLVSGSHFIPFDEFVCPCCNGYRSFTGWCYDLHGLHKQVLEGLLELIPNAFDPYDEKEQELLLPMIGASDTVE